MNRFYRNHPRKPSYWWKLQKNHKKRTRMTDMTKIWTTVLVCSIFFELVRFRTTHLSYWIRAERKRDLRSIQQDVNICHINDSLTIKAHSPKLKIYSVRKWTTLNGLFADFTSFRILSFRLRVFNCTIQNKRFYRKPS